MFDSYSNVIFFIKPDKIRTGQHNELLLLMNYILVRFLSSHLQDGQQINRCYLFLTGPVHIFGFSSFPVKRSNTLHTGPVSSAE